MRGITRTSIIICDVVIGTFPVDQIYEVTKYKAILKIEKRVKVASIDIHVLYRFILYLHVQMFDFSI